MKEISIVILCVFCGIFPFMLLQGYGKIAVFIIVFCVSLIAFNAILKISEKEKKSSPAKLSRKFKKKYPIIIQYFPPKGINSAEAGFLYNCRVEPTDLTSLIYQWAYEGFIEIKDGSDSENMAKIILKKIKNIPESRPFFETDMFNSIFLGNKTTKVISTSNQLKYALFLEDLQIHGENEGWFEKVKIPLYMKILYALLVLSTIISMFFSFEAFLVLFFFVAIMSGYMFGYGNTQLTDKGAELVSYLIGYRNFIKNCDERQIKAFLKEDPLFLDKILPYATAFGLETQFLNKTTPLVEDWNAKYLFGKKVSSLSGIISGISNSETGFFKWFNLVRFLNKF